MSAATPAFPETRTVTAAEFKAKCLQLMDEVNEKHITLIITKRGKPVMQATAPSVEAKPFRSIFGRSASPGAKLPDEKAWNKMKAEHADEWDRSTKRLARQMKGDFSEK